MNRRAYVLSLVFFVFFLSAVTLIFLDFTSAPLPYAASDRGADAIVVLTGGTGRLDEGLTLLRKGLGGVLILSGVDGSADIDSIFHGKGVSSAERARIVLDKASGNTYSNAVEARMFMEANGLTSMTLITSTYHMKRALLIFRRLMPSGVRIEAQAVESPNFDRERWWEGRGLAIAWSEFLKYYWYYLRFSIEDLSA